MRQEAFEEQHRATWRTLEEWIEVLSQWRGSRADDETRARIGTEFPAMYRKVCHHLALARARRYDMALQQRLNALALAGHQHLYRSRTALWHSLFRFAVAGFPAAVRRARSFVALSALLFVGPGLAMAMAVQLDPQIIYSLIEPESVSTMEQMYDPANDHLGRERQSETDVAMFGFYVYNNVSIGFQTFAGGLPFALGSIFYLSFNGLYIGAIASHLTAAGYVDTFWSFVAGHSAFELTAIVIFGGAGLMIGYGAIAPGRKRRWHAVRDRAVRAMPLVYGGTAMLLGAAFVEAFWSSTTWPPLWVKYTVGGLLWTLVAAYFVLMGRSES